MLLLYICPYFSGHTRRYRSTARSITVVQGVEPGSECATRFRVCNQVQGLQPGSGCATSFRVCNQVQGVQPGSGCATRFRVCNQVQGVQSGSGCATRFREEAIFSIPIYMSLLFGSYRGPAVPLNTKSIAVPRYDPKSRGIY